MITVGLVKELNFISLALHTPVSVELKTDLCEKIHLKINFNKMDVWYLGYHIWSEELEGAASFFGVESCDTIARIIVLIDKNDFEQAKSMMFLSTPRLTSLQPPANMGNEAKVPVS